MKVSPLILRTRIRILQQTIKKLCENFQIFVFESLQFLISNFANSTFCCDGPAPGAREAKKVCALPPPTVSTSRGSRVIGSQHSGFD
jgi:hypothetical protein